MVAKWKEEAPYYDFTRDKGDKQTATLPFKIDQSKPWKNSKSSTIIRKPIKIKIKYIHEILSQLKKNPSQLRPQNVEVHIKNQYCFIF